MLQECFKRSDVKVAYLRRLMPQLETARETARELEEAKKTIIDLQREKSELSSAIDASIQELVARNVLLTETLDANSALAEDNTRLTRDLKRMV